MSALLLTARQIRYESRAFWRNPAAAFFTFAFPLIFMVIFNVLFGGEQRPGETYRAADFFTPAIIALSVITACYTNLAMSVTTARDLGILKRIRGTPLPTSIYLAGRIGNALIVTTLLVVIVSAFGYVAYGVQLPVARLAEVLLVLIVGAATFSVLGLAVSGLIPNADAAPAVVNASILPLLFISNVFVEVGPNFPSWLDTISKLFPIRHFADALIAAWDPRPGAAGLHAGPLLVIMVWFVAGVLVAARTFSWEPRS